MLAHIFAIDVAAHAVMSNLHHVVLHIESARTQRWSTEQVLQRWTRLFDLSWCMRVLNESLARQANAEDGCTGRFWEGRFKSQALLDEQALLTAMAYVDLNTVRVGMAESPEASDCTSIQKRLGCAPVPLAQPVTPDLQVLADAAADSPAAAISPLSALLARLCARQQTRFLHGMRAARRVFG